MVDNGIAFLVKISCIELEKITCFISIENVLIGPILLCCEKSRMQVISISSSEYFYLASLQMAIGDYEGAKKMLIGTRKTEMQIQIF